MQPCGGEPGRRACLLSAALFPIPAVPPTPISTQPQDRPATSASIGLAAAPLAQGSGPHIHPPAEQVARVRPFAQAHSAASATISLISSEAADIVERETPARTFRVVGGPDIEMASSHVHTPLINVEWALVKHALTGSAYGVKVQRRKDGSVNVHYAVRGWPSEGPNCRVMICLDELKRPVRIAVRSAHGASLDFRCEAARTNDDWFGIARPASSQAQSTVRQFLETLAQYRPTLEEFGLLRFIDARGDSLSGGERRRVEIARAIATDPAFLLLDEPFTGIDPIAVADIQAMIRQLKDRGLGILITDHQVRETLAIVDRAYILNEGRIEVSGTAQEVLDSPIARKFYLGEAFRL